MPMAKLFTFNFYSKNLFITPTFFLGLVLFLLFPKLNGFDFQCYQNFFKGKPIVLVKFSFLSKEINFISVGSLCVSKVNFNLHFNNNHKIYFEKDFSKSYVLKDEQDPLNTILYDSLWLNGLENGEYEVHFSIQSGNHVDYKKIIFHIDNLWYRVNIGDVELFNKNYEPVFHSISENEDSLLLKFSFESNYSFPLTLRIQIFTEQSEQTNPYAIAYQSIQQYISTINLKKGKNFKWIKIPIEKPFFTKYLIEINFFEEENFVTSKRFELYPVWNQQALKNKYILLVNQYKKLGINLIPTQKQGQELYQEYHYLKQLFEYAKKNEKKLSTLINFGLPNQTIKKGNIESWFFYKFNRKIEFVDGT